MSYDVSGAGPAGVGNVELYMTQDAGKTWKKCCDDPDLESPIDVTLPGEGKYGLTIVVTNKAGVGQRPPQPGEQPQLLVHVDLTPPVAELLPPKPDPENPREVLILSWRTHDDHPAESGAVDLYFTPDPTQGWYKIARGLPATGSHPWKVPQRVPHKVYFRLLARDQCGNEEKIETAKPVIVDLSNPHGKIGAIINVLPQIAERDDQ
jgi:hypothetical protein